MRIGTHLAIGSNSLALAGEGENRAAQTVGSDLEVTVCKIVMICEWKTSIEGWLRKTV
ncbi:MAG: hypothetical protein KIB42_03705 [Varibaculum cambriense]|uniref:Uncharacterized protein n=1 Tax=Varibaculum cambriense TaxID=184870 RepID=A0AAJ1EX78_9ACTO|nr:hypothetical protein [Varibaculum cambriense]MBS5918717.1 hypothetical protein [Varibaculum cambriense]MBS5962959.1 hypothetical protein [Varibaculum cambriense]MCG4616926.1 hypothetical protein [Varibaculum cambriense]